MILSRKLDRKIMIGNDIVVTVVDIRGDKVRIGIEAPKGMPVHREEVFEAIKNNQARQEGESAA